MFSERHARAAAIFDNLHMLPDIMSDILVSNAVPRERKRAAIYAALDEFQSGAQLVTALDEWRQMGHHMGGVELMGGPVPSVRR